MQREKPKKVVRRIAWWLAFALGWTCLLMGFGFLLYAMGSSDPNFPAYAITGYMLMAPGGMLLWSLGGISHNG